jgi:hypothetical protein
LAALPAVALYPAPRARMLWTRALTFMLAAWLDWPRLSWFCPLRVVPRARGPRVAAAASWSSSRGRSPCWRRPQLWSMSWRLRPGCSGPGAALHVGIPARLTRARRAPSPPRIVTCSVHAVPVRPAAAPWTRTWSSPGHAGALLAGGAPSLEQASRAWMLMTLPRSPCRQPGPTGHGSPSSVSCAPCRVYEGPVRPQRRPGTNQNPSAWWSMPLRLVPRLSGLPLQRRHCAGPPQHCWLSWPPGAPRWRRIGVQYCLSWVPGLEVRTARG